MMQQYLRYRRRPKRKRREWLRRKRSLVLVSDCTFIKARAALADMALVRRYQQKHRTKWSAFKTEKWTSLETLVDCWTWN